MVVELTAVQSPQPIRAGILAALVPIVALAGGSLQQIWQVRLAEKLTEPVGWTAARSHPIVELAFSPDGRKLAATMDDHYQAGVWKTHLLILDVQSPQATFRQFDLETCGKFLAWAPDGDALLVCGRVLRLDDGSSCDLLQTSHQRLARNLGNSSYWLTADRVIGGDRTITNLSCHPVETWEMEGDWYVTGTVPAKGWMLLRQSVNQTVNGRTFRHNDYAIADRDTYSLTSGMLFPGSHQAINTIMAEGAQRSVRNWLQLADTSSYTVAGICPAARSFRSRPNWETIRSLKLHVFRRVSLPSAGGIIHWTC
jgi:hypothetical protein